MATKGDGLEQSYLARQFERGSRSQLMASNRFAFTTSQELLSHIEARHPTKKQFLIKLYWCTEPVIYERKMKASIPIRRG